MGTFSRFRVLLPHFIKGIFLAYMKTWVFEFYEKLPVNYYSYVVI